MTRLERARELLADAKYRRSLVDLHATESPGADGRRAELDEEVDMFQELVARELELDLFE